LASTWHYKFDFRKKKKKIAKEMEAFLVPSYGSDMMKRKDEAYLF
jgi:hypothetical protein